MSNDPELFVRFTDEANVVVETAYREARRLNHEYVGTEHLLLGLVNGGSGIASNVMRNLGANLDRIRFEVEQVVIPGPTMVAMENLSQTPRAKKAIEYAMDEARKLNYGYVGAEHLLLGLMREQGCVAAVLLENLGLSVGSIRGEIMKLLRHR